MSAILFPFGVRLSTWLAIAAFISLALAQRSRMPILAGVAWITGFEAAFQAISLTLGKLPLGPDGPIFYILLAAVAVPLTYRAGVRADLRILAVAVALMAAWVAGGFHVNGHTMTGFDPAAEAVNEAAKTLWALAYIAPLWAVSRHCRRRTAPDSAEPPRASLAVDTFDL